MQSWSVSQVQFLSLGLGTPAAALQSLPTVLVVHSASLAQMQKLRPVPRQVELSQVGPLERGLSVQSLSVEAVLAAILGRVPDAAVLHEAHALGETAAVLPQRIELSHSAS